MDDDTRYALQRVNEQNGALVSILQVILHKTKECDKKLDTILSVLEVQTEITDLNPTVSQPVNQGDQNA